MTLSNKRYLSLVALPLLFVGIACNNSDNPDQIRKQTAAATETMRRDTKAVVEGVKEGMRSDKTLDINSASRADLLNLPGMTERDADRIIAERPFKNAHELVARHVIPESEYDKISDRIVAGR
ncbi:MAG: helix-hairpin-helix domain-containing protein [Candidatus Sulfotelmatobacter sp.]